MELKDKLEKVVTEIQNNNQGNSARIQNNKQNIYQTGNTISNMSRIIQEEIKQAAGQAYNRAYRDAYIEDMRNRGYKIKYKHDFKYYIKFAGCIIIVILLLTLICQIPIVKNFVVELYEQNVILKAIVNIFKNTLQQNPGGL